MILLEGRGRIRCGTLGAHCMLDAAEVALVPGEAFGPSGYVRLSYALGDAQLLEGIQRLQKLFS